jgi:GxxExxY protein
MKLDHGYRMDLLVENKIVIELKTVEGFTDVHTAQVLTYLRLGNFKLGLLINFHVSLLKNGIKRIIN